MKLNGLEYVGKSLIEHGIYKGFGVFGEPCTPIGNFLEEQTDKFAWNINEKVSFELALGVSAAGYRTTVIVKQAGVNLLYDTLVNAVVHGIGGGLVIVAADDLDCQLSTVAQDSRALGQTARIPIWEPSSIDTIDSCIKNAFEVSEKCSIPALVRINSTLKSERVECKNENNANITLTKHSVDRKIAWDLSKAGRMHYLDQVKIPKVRELIFRYKINTQNEATDYGLGLIVSGHSMRLLEGLNSFPILNLNVLWPLNEKEIIEFLKLCDKVLIVEEGSNFIEKNCRWIVNKHQVKSVVILGKDNCMLPFYGSIEKTFLENLIEQIKEREFPGSISAITKRGYKEPENYIPLKNCYKAITDYSNDNTVKVVVDAGSSMALNHEPYKVSNLSYGLGSSISVASGLAYTGSKVIAVIGDFGFLHTGIQGLLDASYNNLNMTIVIINDFQSRRTGGQGHITASNQPGKNIMSLEKIISAINVQEFKKIEVNKYLGVDKITQFLENTSDDKLTVALMNIR